MMKRILYYFWNENPAEDCITGLEAIGNTVVRYERKMGNYTRDDAFLEALAKELRSGTYDLIFSFDYFPLLSQGAQETGIPYFSWVYDSPHLTLFSETLSNPCNRVFLFDYALYDELAREGFDTVRYLPLPCNVKRLDALLSGKTGYLHDISFIGTLYEGKDNFYRRIGYLPENLRGYLEAMMTAQQQIYGMNLIESLLTGEYLETFRKHVNVSLEDSYREATRSILSNMLFKEITARDRREMLSLLGKSLGEKGVDISLYSGQKPEGLPVRYCGIAENRQQMPEIFRRSKINLNSTLRSIQTGMPLRVIEIMGAGGFCLTNYQAELAEYFENGKDLVWYESMEDMLDKAEYYLAHDSEREAIATNGRERIAEGFTYEILLKKMLEETT
jgi:spore maturation protein CgeB